MELEPATLIIISAAAAALPALLYAAVIYWFDQYEKEPAWLLAAAFVWGAIPAVLLALVLTVAISGPLQLMTGPATSGPLGAILLAPPIEETTKALALLAIFLFLPHEVDSVLDGIIYGAMVGMGFAMVENVFFFVSVYQREGLEAWRLNILLRAIFFGLNHALFTAFSGLGLAIARFNTRPTARRLAPFLGWAVAVSLHAVHNLAATVGGALLLLLPVTDWGGVFLILLIILWALWQERRWIREYLEEEVRRGTLTAAQYRTACSLRARLAHRLSILFSHGWRAYLDATRFYRHCSELAYKKHHYALVQDPSSRRRGEQLRATIMELNRRIRDSGVVWQR